MRPNGIELFTRADQLVEMLQSTGAAAPAEDGWREKLAQQKLRLQSLRDQARERYAGGAPGLQVAALICDMTDEVIRELFESALHRFPAVARETIQHQVAVVAVGGTGRGELAPYSDVDLLFLVLTPSGVPMPSPGFVKFESDGLGLPAGAKDYVRLDVDREWLLLRSLLTSPEIGVQFMFVCHEIEALLIDHARALGEPDELVARAETVMLQPSDSLRHDDHVHLRIACSPDEAVSGCSGGGPRWRWLPPYNPPVALETQELLEIARQDPLEAE